MSLWVNIHTFRIVYGGNGLLWVTGLPMLNILKYQPKCREKYRTVKAIRAYQK